MINTSYILPLLVLFICVIALLRRVNAYHSFIEGVKDGIFLFSDIYPALLAMMCAITLLRESGLMEVIVMGLLPILKEFLKRYGRWSFFARFLVMPL